MRTPRIGLALALALGVLAGCGSQSATTAPGAATAAPTAAAAATATAAPAATTVTTGTTALPAMTATAATTGTATAAGDTTQKIVTAADAFLATLSDAEKAAVSFEWTDSAQKQRWSNLPEGLYTRDGLMWGDLSETQQNGWLELMKVTLSEEGYARVIAAWNADDALVAQDSGGAAPGGTSGPGGTPPGGGTRPTGGPGGGPGGGQLLYGKQYYWIALIGTPSATEPWQWQWGGHHITANATVAGSEVALVPSFIGCQPCAYTDASGATVRPLGDIEDEAFALVNALDDTQKQAAVLGSQSIDLVLGPGEDGKTIQAEGLPGAQMTAEQKQAFMQLIGHYAGIINEEDAAARMAEIEAGLDQTYLAWYGSTTEGEAGYFRVTGPALVIEYSPQSMGGDAANHIHGIYRDPSNEYGAKITQ